MAVKRIRLLNVPLDILPESDIPETIKHLSSNGGKNRIVMLDFPLFMKAYYNRNWRRVLEEAALVLPTSGALIRGAAFLDRGELYRYRPFEFIIRILGVLDSAGRSLYLIGNHPKEMQTIWHNLKTSFPNINIVGRYAGYYRKEEEKNILTAISKASPHLLLAGHGLKGRNLWLVENSAALPPGIHFWQGDCFDIFSGKKKKSSLKQWERGYDRIPELLRRPWRLLRVFTRLHYGLLLLFYKIRKK